MATKRVAPEKHGEAEVSIPAHAIPEIRSAIIAGMSAVGEIERLQNVAGLLKMAGDPIPEELRATHPGCVTLAEFASALLWLEAAA